MEITDPPKTLYLMCGLSFSGKSTLAAAIVRKLGCLLISLDEINNERGVGFGGDGVAVEEWERTHQIAVGKLEEYTRSGRNIVLDDTNCFRWLRDKYRSVATAKGYSTVVIHLDLPLDVLQERMLKNESAKERRAVKPDIFSALSRQFEPPEADEPTLVFTSGETVDAWMNQLV